MPFRIQGIHPKRKRWSSIIVVVLFIVVQTAWGASRLGVCADGEVHFIYFYDPNCPTCAEVHSKVLEPLLAEYGARIAVEERSIAESANFDLLLDLEQAYKVQAGSIPEVFIGKDVLVGPEPIKAALKERIEHYLAQGGVAIPDVAVKGAPTVVATVPTVSMSACDLCDKVHGSYGGTADTSSTPSHIPTQQASAVEDAAAKPIIHAAFFYQPGCDECERSEHDLEYIQDTYPQFQVRRLNIKQEVALNQYLCGRARVPEGKQLTAPALFIGNQFLLGDQVRGRAIEDLIGPYLTTGVAEPWAGWEANKATAEATIVDRFRSFRLATIAGAGLLDGINPCAFATIIFLISYLTVYEHKKRELLAAGIAFTAGVFLTYIGVGFGFLRFLAALPFLNVIGKWLYGLTMLLCLALAWGSIADYFKARAGKAQDMTLRLPDRFRSWIKRWIRKGASVRQFVPASFALGFGVSVVELACTGQVYLPTLVFVLGIPEWRTQAGLALLLYNIMFILPLVGVFLLVYFGTTSEQLMSWLTRKTAAIKLGTAALFLLLAGWLAYSLVAL